MNNPALGNTLRYLRFLAGSHSRFAVHSPFVYELVEKVLRKGLVQGTGIEIEKLRKEARRSRQVIMKTDFGSMSRMPNAGVRKNATANVYPVSVGHMARKSTLPARRARQLYSLVSSAGAKHVLELGTSLGFTTAWLALALPDGGRIISLEGCPETVRLARRTLERLGLADKVSIITGPFTETLPAALEMMPAPDFIFIDGHHLKEPTLDYFRQCLHHRTERTVIVIDDIHHSAEMEDAWNAIKAMPETRVTIDLFRMGWVFFREGLSRQHFVLRY